MSIITGFSSQKYSDFDMRNYVPIGADGTIPTPNNKPYTTLLNTIGEGFLSIAMLGSKSVTDVILLKLKITIDGMAYEFLSKSTVGGSAYVGFVMDDYMIRNGASETNPSTISFYLTGLTNAIQDQFTPVIFLKETASYLDGQASSPMPIFFNTSLKVEYSTVGSHNPGVGYRISGGLLV